MIAYKLTRADCGGWMHCGTTPSEASECLRHELEMQDEGMPVEIRIESYETTQAEIDALPEFPGW